GRVTDYSARIDWGNGQTLPGRVVVDPVVAGQFDVVGTVLYRDAGSHPITVAIEDAGGARATAEGVSLVVVPTTAASLDFVAEARVSFNSVVATILTGASDDHAADFSALIDWGDGHTSTGLVTKDPAGDGKLRVLGSSTYTQTGTYPVRIEINARNGFK